MTIYPSGIKSYEADARGTRGSSTLSGRSRKSLKVEIHGHRKYTCTKMRDERRGSRIVGQIKKISGWIETVEPFEIPSSTRTKPRERITVDDCFEILVVTLNSSRVTELRHAIFLEDPLSSLMYRYFDLRSA